MTLHFNLVTFPGRPGLAVTVQGRLGIEGRRLWVVYNVRDEHGLVHWPQVATLGERKDDLWRGTCGELFIAADDSDTYWEYNFSPSGDWNCYRHSGYRRGTVRAREVDQAEVQLNFDARHGVLYATSALPPLTSKPWHIGINMVIVSREGDTAHFGLVHPNPDKPDFHHRDGFQLTWPVQAIEG